MATIKDVAKRAGVSPSTASRAMHDSPLISEETKDKVRQAMKELDYSPNFAAQNLANQTSNTIGVILPAREEAVGIIRFYPDHSRLSLDLQCARSVSLGGVRSND